MAGSKSASRYRWILMTKYVLGLVFKLLQRIKLDGNQEKNLFFTIFTLSQFSDGLAQ